jgi:hypothetical protein
MTRNDINKLFGAEATDENLLLMKDTWTMRDILDYLDQTGYEVNPTDVYNFLQNFEVKHE